MICKGSRVRIIACHNGTYHGSIGATGIASSCPIGDGIDIILDNGRKQWFYLDEVEEINNKLTLVIPTFEVEEYRPCQLNCNTFTSNTNGTCCDCSSNNDICNICGGLR